MLNTIGIMTLLKGEAEDEVVKLWDHFEQNYNSVIARKFGHPNLSYQGGECYNTDIIESSLGKFTKKATPFEVIIDGFDYFEHPNRVIYLNVIKNKQLMDLHFSINDILNHTCESTLDVYSPPKWIPHITVAMRDISIENFKTSLQELKNHRYYKKLIIDNLSLVKLDRDTGKLEIINSWNFY